MSWDDPSWRKAAADYHKARGGRCSVVEIEPDRLRALRRLLDDSVSLERACSELSTIKGRAAASTVAALIYGLRDRGVDALDEPNTRRRIAQLSDEQAIEVGYVSETLSRRLLPRGRPRKP